MFSLETEKSKARETEVKVGEYWSLHEDEALSKIDDAAVRLLSHSGCRIYHEGLLSMLGAAGCRTEPTARLCFFPEKLVREAIAHLGGHVDETVDIPVGWNPQRRLRMAGSYPHFLDWPSGGRRLATKQDLLNMAKMAHQMEDFVGIGRVLIPTDVEPAIEPLWSNLLLAQTTDKPILEGEIFSGQTVEPLVRMGEVLTGKTGDTSLIADCDFFISPLRFDRGQAECFLEKRRFGIPNVPGTMPISGMSAPITPAGTAALAVAELMAGWVMGYVVNPELSAGGIVASGSLDMRTAAACFGSPEAVLQDTTVVQVCRRLYGIRVSAATGYVDCKRPGIEATFQKMFPLVAVPYGAGGGLSSQGLLSAGQGYSPVQHLLDAEIQAAVQRFRGGFSVNRETLAADVIAQAMQQESPDFLSTDHTLKHFRQEQWYPRWFDRRLWQGEEQERESEETLIRKIDETWRDAVSRYEKPEIDGHRIGELRRIFLHAERGILGGNTTPL
jgi:trimethylamine--corrinoid protein Co-methyltransferase